MSEDLQYPIGKFQRPATYSIAEFETSVARLSAQADRWRKAIDGLSDAQLDTPYRPGGWTVRQVVHHTADSHVNMYMRLKWALTEENPTIRPYDQDVWATLADVRDVPVATSVELFDAVQQRALAVLRNTTEADRLRPFVHPENGPTLIFQLAALYAWHGDHHLAHVENLRKRMNW